jgi:hypothetical protein
LTERVTRGELKENVGHRLKADTDAKRAKFTHERRRRKDLRLGVDG